MDRYIFSMLLKLGYDYMLLRAMSPEERTAQLALESNGFQSDQFKANLESLENGDKGVLEILKSKKNSPGDIMAHKMVGADPRKKKSS